jgi:hypothetical protein
MLGFVGTTIYDLIHFGNRKSRTSVPPASDQMDSGPVEHAVRFEILLRWWLVERILACLTATGGSPPTWKFAGRGKIQCERDVVSL